MSERDAGFTLVEVLAALVIMGLAVTLAANILNWQVRLAKHQGEEIETQQAVKTAMLYLEREIRCAQSVSLPAGGVLKIVRNNGQNLLFYVDDKDNNAIKDLYREIDGVATPLVSRVVEVRFVEQLPGTWEISLLAQQGGEEYRCQFVARKRSS